MMKKMGTKLISSTLLFSMLAYSAAPVLAYTKEESVYSKLDNNGIAYQTIVSNHLKNTEKSELLKDISDLMNIENVSGNQEYEEDNGRLIWKAEGEDIYYQGNSKKELPIECKISYKLDGQEISKEDIIGKSGFAKVIFEFTNKEQRKATINGKEETMYVPFIVGIGTVIDNENNKNIEISSGKVIDNGNKTFVFGVALPGMQESLGIDKNTIDIPNSIEISMEAKDFEMNEIYCFATPKLIDEDDLELFNKIDKIYDMATELKDGSSKLVEGSQQLSEGAGKLNAGTHELSKELNTQIAKYENARKKLENKKELEEKIVNIINNEMKRIMPELQTLAEEEAKNVVKENLKGENGLEEKTAKTALDYTKIAINTKLNELEKSNTEIKIPDELLNQIQKDVMIAVKNVENKQDVQALENTIKNLVIKDITNIVKGKTNEVITENVETMKTNITDPTALMSESEKAALNQSKNQIAQAMVPGIKIQYPNLTDEQAYAQALSSVNQLVTSVSKGTMDKTLDQVKNQTPTMVENTVNEIATNLSTNEALEQAISNYVSKITTEIKATVGEETLNAIKNNIKNEIIQELQNTFKNDLTLQEQISSMVKEEINPTIDVVAEQTAIKLAEDFTEELANQIASNLIKKQLSGELSGTELDKELSKYEDIINSKLGEVDGQIEKLKEALNQLTAGTDTLENGANELQNGMRKFDEEGIQKIYNIVNNNVRDLQFRVKKLRELSNEYNTFTNIDENAKGNVKFIMMIDSLKKEEEKKEQAILPAEIKEEEE
ncbi:MAG: hypothetical protein J6M60_01835 [Clostridia bacterium]|nr:hypothetical protein [Clostridia bacterium]